MNNKKSLSINLILNIIKSVLSILFPLITLPYISRVLSQDSIGEYNYATSIINYFVLISGLGIKTFAIREAGNHRGSQKEFDDFASEMFSLNVFFTIVAYVLLALSFPVFSTFRSHSRAILILSFSICFTTIGVEWIYNIFEDFGYMTVRSILVQVCSLFIMFVFVKDVSDAYIYMAITVIANGGANILGWFYARKYCNLKLLFDRKIFSSIVPVFVIFSTTLATVIYVNSDITMLGILKGDRDVGVYSVASKMYNVVKSVMNGIVPVYMARLAMEYSSDRDKYYKTFKQATDVLVSLTIPSAFGVMVFGREIVLMLSTEEYLGAVPGMQILFVSLIFATMGNLLGSGALLLEKKEKIMLIATTIGAVINLVINFILIPVMGTTGAAVGTLCTEVAVCTILLIAQLRCVKAPIAINSIIKSFIASVPFIGIYQLYSFLNTDFNKVAFILYAGLCALEYFIFMLVMKDEAVVMAYDKLKNKLRLSDSK
ncbi:flippase [Butyrivibrio fibrisolvens]|uniref:flippase n=1 Tax=Butyrivibrio fibrisolvens TaxID=831 RepID=UPI0003B6EF70|nr:flippase [Butyrivibrio fibrisolvens]